MTEKEKRQGVAIFVTMVVLVMAPDFFVGFHAVMSPRALALRGVYWIGLFAGLIAVWRRIGDLALKRWVLFLLVLYPYIVWFVNITQFPFYMGPIVGVVYLTYIPLAVFIFTRVSRALHLENTHPDPAVVETSRRRGIAWLISIVVTVPLGLGIFHVERLQLERSSDLYVRQALPAALTARAPAELGPFLIYTDVTRVALSRGTPRLGRRRLSALQPALADYVAVGTFAGGDARITVRLRKYLDEDWEIETLRIDPTTPK